MSNTTQNTCTTLNSEYLTVSDVRHYLKISLSTAYQLVHDKDFPVCRIGSSFRIPRNAFLAWVDKQTSIPAHLSEYMALSQEVA